MAGFITVPLYPTTGAETALYVLEHSEAKMLFAGKLDGISDSWNQLRDVLPASLPKIALPMTPLTDAPQWADRITRLEPPPGSVVVYHVEQATSVASPRQ